MKIVFVLLVIIIIVLLILLYKKGCYDNIQLVQFALKKYMKDFDKICSDNNISYWADSGTLLGAVRNKGIIPHDDDIDVCVFQKDFDKLSDVLKTHPVYELIILGNFSKVKRRDVNANVWIDIFIVSNEKGIIKYAKEEHRNLWPKMIYKEYEVFPLQRVPFEDYYITVPNNPIPYLERSYGKDWKTPVVYDRHKS
jgi:lipopolysaccharide cholinephosphotransferase